MPVCRRQLALHSKSPCQSCSAASRLEGCEVLSPRPRGPCCLADHGQAFQGHIRRTLVLLMASCSGHTRAVNWPCWSSMRLCAYTLSLRRRAEAECPIACTDTATMLLPVNVDWARRSWLVINLREERTRVLACLRSRRLAVKFCCRILRHFKEL